MWSSETSKKPYMHGRHVTPTALQTTPQPFMAPMANPSLDATTPEAGRCGAASPHAQPT